MAIAFKMRLIANSPPNVNPNSRAIRFSSIVILRCERSTQVERMRSWSDVNSGIVEHFLLAVGIHIAIPAT
jgi:hypothetical protein